MRRASPTILFLVVACGSDNTQPVRQDHGVPDLPRYVLDNVPWPLADQGVGDHPAGDLRGPDLKAKLDGATPLAAKCGGTAKLLLAEVATGQPDYLALLNVGPSPIDLTGFRLQMMGIGLEIYTFKAGQSIGAGKLLYVFEYSTGKAGDVSTGGNLPFYDNKDSNSVALWDAAANLLDFVGIGDKVVFLPAGAAAAAVPWPTGYDWHTQSFQRMSQAGACPSFSAADWAVKPITRPP